MTYDRDQASRNNQYHREYQRMWRMKKKALLIGVHDPVPRRHRRVMVEYPCCAYPDWMSKHEYDRWTTSDWPDGTRIWIDGELVSG